MFAGVIEVYNLDDCSQYPADTTTFFNFTVLHGPSCNSSADCPVGQTCVSGACVDTHSHTCNQGSHWEP